MRPPNILCSEDSLGHLNGLGRRAAQHFGGFLHQMKGRQKVVVVERKDSTQAVFRRMRGLEEILY